MLWRSRGRLGIRNNETLPRSPAVPRRRVGYSFRHANSSAPAVPRLRPLAGMPPHAADQRHSRNASYGREGSGYPHSLACLRAMAVAEAQSASVYRKASMLIKQIFADALTCDLIQVDPTTKYTFKRVRREKEDTGEEYLTDAQVATLLAAIKGIYPLETFVKLGLYAGLRREESLALQWDCVDLNADTPQIEVTRTCIFCHNRPEISNVTKTAAGHRNIPIPVPLFNHLKGIKKSVASDFVICNSSGLPLSETQFRNMWRKIKRRSVGPDEYIRYKQHGKKSHSVNREAGRTAAHNPNVRYIIDFPVKTHMLRKTYITNLIYSGVDVRTVMDYAGHKNPDVTLKIYAQAKSAEKRTESAKQINEVFPSDPTT